MSERWFEGFYMELRFDTNEALVMWLSDCVTVRTRSVQRQEREVSVEMLKKLVGVPWDPTGVIRARADGGHHEGEHFTPDQIASEDGFPVNRWHTPISTYITSDLARQYVPTVGCPNCVFSCSRRFHQSDSAALTCWRGTHRRTGRKGPIHTWSIEPCCGKTLYLDSCLIFVVSRLVWVSFLNAKCWQHWCTRLAGQDVR